MSNEVATQDFKNRLDLIGHLVELLIDEIEVELHCVIGERVPTPTDQLPDRDHTSPFEALEWLDDGERRIRLGLMEIRRAIERPNSF